MPSCIYHYPCPDGVLAALAFYLAHKGQPVHFHPLTTWAKEPEREALLAAIPAQDTVYVVDISGSAAFLSSLCAKAGRVVLLDHHKAAFQVLEELGAGRPGNLEAVLDLQRSGCMLALDHFQLTAAPYSLLGGSEAAAARLQQLYALAQDADLFRWSLPGSHAFAAALGALKLEYNPAKAPALFTTLLELDPQALTASGTALLAEQAATRAAEREAAFAVRIPTADAAAPLECLAIVTAHPDLRSEAGNELASLSAARGMAGAAVVAYVEAGAGEGCIKVSIRSLGELDVANVCKVHGGNGHKVSGGGRGGVCASSSTH